MKKVFFTFLTGTFFLLIAWMQPAVPKATMERGKVVYDKACLSCHMPNGLGVPRMAPSLSKSKYVLGTKTKMIRIVLRGSEELPVNEDRDFTNPMAPILNLTDQQLADVLTFVRNSYGNRASVITAADVKYVKARMN
ncbi:MAG TPA: cytochrome c [Chitinophagaceae bacterium]|nr:cytochrome c [Chitinophagaceae bacterium]